MESDFILLPIARGSAQIGQITGDVGLATTPSWGCRR